MDRNVRIWQLGVGEERGLWERRLASMFWSGGELVKRDSRGREVWRANADAGDLAVKARPLLGIRERVRFWFGATDLGRSVLGAALLSARGFETPRVRVLGIVRTESGWLEVLVTDWVDGETLLSAWAEADERERLALARRAGEHVGRLASSGVFNRDAKPSNVVLREDGGFEMVDVGGVRLSGNDPARELARMIGAQGFEPTGVGHGANAGQVAACVRAAMRGSKKGSGPDRRTRGRVIAMLRREILEHGDPAPEDDPLRKA
ncbi:MAG: hypothetical protein KDA31_06690 [Phycisphaerales bacterium]|nr:hypothetical protein [Phycisphaerales bacterium]MCB9836016.1 hypothetical protein [Phycisphaera sp.]